jgi:hypothetical protein
LRRAVLSCFFTVTALLESANVSQSLESDGNQLDTRIFECTGDLLRCAGRNVIGELGSSEAVCTRLLSEDETFSGQPFKVMLKSVVTEADPTQESGVSSRSTVSKLGQNAFIKEVHYKLQ